MTKNQYENIVAETIKNAPADKGGLDTVRDILKNLGIGFPKGNVKEITDALETEDFMGWEKCSGKEAEEALENGTPVIAVSCDRVFVVTGNKGMTGISGRGAITQEELKRLPGVLMYMYSGDTTDGYPVAPHFSDDLFIRNSVTGKFLVVSSGSPALVSSPNSLFDNSAKWKFIYPTGVDHCYIVPAPDISNRLCVSNNGSIYLENSGTPNKAIRWNVLVSDTQDFLIRNKNISGYLSGLSIPYIHSSPVSDSEWSICDINGITVWELPMNCNMNQKFYQNEYVIRDEGCFVCACCDVASFYNGSPYTLQDMVVAGVYIPGSATCHYSAAPSANISQYIGSITGKECEIIKQELLQGRPVIVHIGYGNDFAHYVVAYGFVNGGASYSDFKVLDPCNLDNPYPGLPQASYNTNGKLMSLQESITEQGGYLGVQYTIRGLYQTSPKS